MKRDAGIVLFDELGAERRTILKCLGTGDKFRDISPDDVTHSEDLTIASMLDYMTVDITQVPDRKYYQLDGDIKSFASRYYIKMYKDIINCQYPQHDSDEFDYCWAQVNILVQLCYHLQNSHLLRTLLSRLNDQNPLYNRVKLILDDMMPF